MRGLLALACVALTGWGPAAWSQMPAGATPNFALTDGAGRIVRTADFRGHYLLVMFGYTGCPDICPDTLYEIAAALRVLPNAAAWRVVFISIDPAHDTPALTARYAALFSSRIIGLSGTAAQVQQAVAEFHIYVGPRDPRSGAIAHGALLYILNPAGKLTAVLPDQLSSTQLAAQLSRLAPPPHPQ
jgi:protein SCO1/2